MENEGAKIGISLQGLRPEQARATIDAAVERKERGGNTALFREALSAYKSGERIPTSPGDPPDPEG